MPSINVRDLDPRILAALKRRAKRHHRSLHGEIHAILEAAAARVPPEPAEPLRLIFATGTRGDDADWSRDAIYDDDAR